MSFSPLAWLKLQLFLHAGDTEVGGFGVSSPHDPLYIEDFVTVLQYVSAVTVAFDDQAVADYFDRSVDQGLNPAQFARIWLHTHPGESPEPSSVDEQTFERVFGGCEWALMFILGRTGRTYARLQFFSGPGGEILLPVRVDWEAWPALVLESPEELTRSMAGWGAEYEANVVAALPRMVPAKSKRPSDRWSAPQRLQDPFEQGLEALYEARWSEQQILDGFEQAEQEGFESAWEAEQAKEVCV